MLNDEQLFERCQLGLLVRPKTLADLEGVDDGLEELEGQEQSARIYYSESPKCVLSVRGASLTIPTSLPPTSRPLRRRGASLPGDSLLTVRR